MTTHDLLIQAMQADAKAVATMLDLREQYRLASRARDETFNALSEARHALDLEMAAEAGLDPCINVWGK